MMMDRRHVTGTGMSATQTSAWSASGGSVAGATRDRPVEALETLLAEARDHLAGWRFQAARQVLAAAYTGLGRTDHTDQLAAQIAVLYAEVLRDSDRLADARTLAEPLVEDLTARHGLRHPATVQALAVLGAVYHDLDRLDDADGCYHLVLRSGAAPHGPAGRAIRRTAANMALLRYDLGQTADAVRELTAAHAALRTVQGAANPDTLHVAADLARLLHRLDRTTAARELLAASIAAARAGLSDDHPLVGRLTADLISLTDQTETDQKDQTGRVCRPVGHDPGRGVEAGGPIESPGRHRVAPLAAAAPVGVPRLPGASDPRLLVAVPLIGVVVWLAVAALLGAVSPLQAGPRR